MPIANLIGQAYAYSEDDGTYTLREIKPMNTTRPAIPMFENYKDEAENVYVAGAEINNGVAYIKVDGTKYIVDADTEFVDVTRTPCTLASRMSPTTRRRPLRART